MRCIPLAEAGRRFENAAVPAQYAAEGQQFLGLCVCAGDRASIGHAMQEGAGRGEAKRPVADRLVHQFAHAVDVGLAGGLLVEAAFVHRVIPHRAVPDHAADVDALGHRCQGVEVLAVGLPVPRQSGHDGLAGNVLHGLHHLREVTTVFGLAGGERHAAVAEHDRGDAVVAGRRGDRIPAQLRIEVRVDVDETGCDVLAVRADLALALFFDLADLRYAVAVDGDIRGHRGTAGAVDHLAAPDHDVMAHGSPCGRRGRPVRLD